MHLFQNDDAGYVSWLQANRTGFVVRCNANPVKEYLKLHRATCLWINPPKYQNWTTVGFIKVCSGDLAELQDWAESVTGGVLQPCQSCRPPLREAPGAVTTDIPRASSRPTSGGAVKAEVADLASAGSDRGETLTLPSGLRIRDPFPRLLRFCRQEYDYYDGIADTEPNRVLPVDILATISVNSFIQYAVQVRRIHRGLAPACDPLLPGIPRDADLLAFDPSLVVFERLMRQAVAVPDVGVARAVKVLHRKRRNYIPMLDSVVLNHYLGRPNTPSAPPAPIGKPQAVMEAVEALRRFREDLRATLPAVSSLVSRLAEESFDLSPVRTLEIAVWTETEPQGYYRK